MDLSALQFFCVFPVVFCGIFAIYRAQSTRRRLCPSFTARRIPKR
jgi:hypothetical protein